jgi:hypothetical protein
MLHAHKERWLRPAPSGEVALIALHFHVSRFSVVA